MDATQGWPNHVLNGESWFRLLLMLLLAPLLACVGFLILCVALFQFFSVLASGESNPQLRALGRDLGHFCMEMVDFLTYNSERKPFPFTPGVPLRESEACASGDVGTCVGSRRKSVAPETGSASSVPDAQGKGEEGAHSK
jgi:hypothetical protein